MTIDYTLVKRLNFTLNFDSGVNIMSDYSDQYIQMELSMGDSSGGTYEKGCFLNGCLIFLVIIVGLSIFVNLLEVFVALLIIIVVIFIVYIVYKLFE